MCAHVPVCLCAVTHTWRSETACRSWFSLITVWIPGGELGVVCLYLPTEPSLQPPGHIRRVFFPINLSFPAQF